MSFPSPATEVPATENAEHNRDDLAHEPIFTAQDEQRELATLSIADITSLQSDLTGISVGLSTLCLGGTSTTGTCTAAAAAAAIAAMNEEVAKLPSAQTAAYRRATIKCPDQVSDERKTAFLEFENGNVALAALRLARYWEYRLEVFGPYRCFLPLTLNGAMKDEVTNLMFWRVHQPMPVTDTAGRAVLYFCPGRRNFEVYSVEQDFMALLYLLEIFIEDPDLRRRGVVSIIDGSTTQRNSFSGKLKRYSNLLESVVPIRFRAFHLCYPSPVFFYLIIPVMKRFLPRSFRLRMKIHYGSEAKVLADLENYCLPKDRLPVELGGSVVLDMQQWVMDRLALERSNSAAGSPAAKRRRSEEISTPVIASSTAACAQPSTNINAEGRGKAKRSGKPMDHRMAKAMEIRLDDPEISLYDALVAGGFVFREDTGKNITVDADGVTLTQRKNNLCRRLRIEKKKRKAEKDTQTSATSSSGFAQLQQSVVSGPSSSSAPPPVPSPVHVEESPQNQVESGIPVVGHVPPPSVQSAEGAVTADEPLATSTAVDESSASRSSSSRTSGDNKGENAAHAEKRDSFYDSILDLPSIKDMMNDDDDGDNIVDGNWLSS
mmetsp:Transcript_2840/g.6577  ORF Transcript_2840/g.6577 Transcript_2840/m.6577 type:complete len:604 (+) Transcript_2840:136-1947(+)